MKIIGISAFYHDSAAALLIDGEIHSAAQEERFTRKKHDSCFPIHALSYLLKNSGSQLEDIDFFVFYEKPFLKFERLMETYLNFSPRGFLSFQKAFPLWIKEKLFQKKLILEYLQKLDTGFKDEKRILFNEHHLSHGASAFYPSPFNEALVLTMDGIGEWATTSVSIGEGSGLKKVREIHFPHSLGLFYSAFTYFAGFKVNSGEYKLMGLAPYGDPVYKDIILREILKLHGDGSFSLNLKYFDFCTGLRMTNSHFSELFNVSPRLPEQPISKIYMDIAASAQKVLEEAVLNLTRSLSREFKMKNLCLAGGVALNCVANSGILKQGCFENIWIQPAAGDAGGSLGAALSCWYQHLGKKRSPKGDLMKGSLLGPAFSQDFIESELRRLGAVFKSFDSQEEVIETTTESLIQGKTVGWFQGAMEFGPRALGQRSILADPRQSDMQKKLNMKIKFRESFRPFAPSVLKEESPKWFQEDIPSPYMLMTFELASSKKLMTENTSAKGLDRLHEKRSVVPAVTHVDGSARVQTVDQKTSPLYHKLIRCFFEKTGCPMLVNTSFNVRGEPIVCTPEDAFRCFMKTGLDVLTVGHSFLVKSDQKPTIPSMGWSHSKTTNEL